MSKGFTPGEWSATNHSVYKSGGYMVCNCDGPNREANARLIAQAPALYEGLKWALDLLEDLDRWHQNGKMPSPKSFLNDKGNQRREDLKAILAAIEDVGEKG